MQTEKLNLEVQNIIAECELNPNITTLTLTSYELTILPDLSHLTSIKKFICRWNYLKLLYDKDTGKSLLPPNLEELHCNYNSLLDLDHLPPSIKIIDCSHNRILNIINLPPNLENLNCLGNKLTHLDNLPNGLKVLRCDQNDIIYLDN